MKSIKPEITDVVPPAPIVISVPEGQVFGVSGVIQLHVDLELTGTLPATAILSLEILSPQLYLFSDGTSKKRFSMAMNSTPMTASLAFQIKNMSFFPGAQPALDIGVFAWEQETGENFKRSDFASIDVTVVRPAKLKFKKFKIRK